MGNPCASGTGGIREVVPLCLLCQLGLRYPFDYLLAVFEGYQEAYDEPHCSTYGGQVRGAAPEQSVETKLSISWILY